MARRISKDLQTTAESLWIRMMANNPLGLFQKYNMHADYKRNEGIEHPLFGLGFVQKCNSSDITVLFREGEKRLAKNIRN